MDNEIIRVGSCADKRKTTTTCPKTFRNANKIQQCLRWRSQIEDFTWKTFFGLKFTWFIIMAKVERDIRELLHLRAWHKRITSLASVTYERYFTCERDIREILHLRAWHTRDTPLASVTYERYVTRFPDVVMSYECVYCPVKYPWLYNKIK